ncbi:hypothetical protein [Oscillatoria sp. FACHB-1406]|uniref:hypothetical protein n=1 Tax=Oscillatoria sp. FACHB-1406 TaxID=2692846 RepID=UPI00168208BA|nr:hypothetical protein [Oscillatoria sp. FACHB-1406]MBD2579179.1 hypothetical protein [Oscillatoria sp. FACHB-1406]
MKRILMSLAIVTTTLTISGVFPALATVENGDRFSSEIQNNCSSKHRGHRHGDRTPTPSRKTS